MRLFFIALATACSLTAISQTLEQTASIYYAYPGPQTVQTETPEGFTPFYVSHYGRHGSRWITDDYRYTTVYEALDSTENLTPLGLDVRERLQAVLADALGRSGSLTPLGQKQHHDIAKRMYSNYPQIFADSAVIKAVSSTSLRCAMSMSYFTEALKECVPSLDVTRTAYDRDMDYIAYTSPEAKVFSADTAFWRAKHKAYTAEIVKPERLMASLFINPDALDYKQQMKLMDGLYWIASDMQNVDLDISLYDIFTYDELQAIWRTINARMYLCNGDAPLAQGVMKQSARHLLADFIDCADQAIATGEVSANLRFGHDTHLIRLLSLMSIDGCEAQETDMAKFHEVWQDYKLSPMAANLQMVFYRNHRGDILVKLMLNENEVTLPIESDSAPYYDWTTLRSYLTGLLD